MCPPAHSCILHLMPHTFSVPACNQSFDLPVVICATDSQLLSGLLCFSCPTYMLCLFGNLQNIELLFKPTHAVRANYYTSAPSALSIPLLPAGCSVFPALLPLFAFRARRGANVYWLWKLSDRNACTKFCLIYIYSFLCCCIPCTYSS